MADRHAGRRRNAAGHWRNRARPCQFHCGHERRRHPPGAGHGIRPAGRYSSGGACFPTHGSGVFDHRGHAARHALETHSSVTRRRRASRTQKPTPGRRQRRHFDHSAEQPSRRGVPKFIGHRTRSTVGVGGQEGDYRVGAPFGDINGVQVLDRQPTRNGSAAERASR